MRPPKMLAAAVLWAGLIWFLGLTLDRMLGLHSLYRMYGWPALGICFAIAYFYLRRYSYRRISRQRSVDYEALRDEIRRILADVIYSPDEDLIRATKSAYEKIEKVLDRYEYLDVGPQMMRRLTADAERSVKAG
jgi:hypothetical protein